jgi:hypothetical protein
MVKARLANRQAAAIAPPDPPLEYERSGTMPEHGQSARIVEVG